VPPIADQEQREQLSLFDLGIDMQTLKLERQKLNGHTRAKNSAKAIEADWRLFTAWCASVGRSALPTTPETVELYLTDEMRAGRKHSTLSRRTWSIAEKHKAAGEASPISDAVREVLAAIARVKGTAPEQKAALTPEELRAMAESCDTATERGIRDRSVLVVGFASGLRRSELVALDLADVRFVDGRGLVITVRRAKNDQAGEGRQFGIFAGKHASTCPVRTLKAWLKVRGRQPGPLWGISVDTVWDIVRRAAERAGLDPERFGAHSLRAGMITTAIANGSPEALVMQRSGHKSHSSFQKYVRPSKLFNLDLLDKAL
jgi:site-specific recombinase XerD